MRDVLQQAETYKRTYAIVGRAHYIAGDRALALNRWLGIPVIIITAVVGTTIFGTLNENPDTRLRIFAGLISLAGVVLSSLQTSLGFAQTAERHRAVAAQYRAIKRRLELFSLKYADASPDKRAEAIAELEGLNRELAELAPEGPNLADKYFDRAEKDYEAEHRRTNAHAVPADVQATAAPRT